MSIKRPFIEIAEHIAEYFSADAAHWPNEGRRAHPVPIRWIAGENEPIVHELVRSLNSRLSSPFRAPKGADSLSIVAAGAAGATAEVTFFVDHRPHDGPGVRYELTFPDVDDVWPGWFATPAT